MNLINKLLSEADRNFHMNLVNKFLSEADRNFHMNLINKLLCGPRGTVDKGIG